MTCFFQNMPVEKKRERILFCILAGLFFLAGLYALFLYLGDWRIAAITASMPGQPSTWEELNASIETPDDSEATLARFLALGNELDPYLESSTWTVFEPGSESEIRSYLETEKSKNLIREWEALSRKKIPRRLGRINSVQTFHSWDQERQLAEILHRFHAFHTLRITEAILRHEHDRAMQLLFESRWLADWDFEWFACSESFELGKQESERLEDTRQLLMFCRLTDPQLAAVSDELAGREKAVRDMMRKSFQRDIGLLLSIINGKDLNGIYGYYAYLQLGFRPRSVIMIKEHLFDFDLAKLGNRCYFHWANPVLRNDLAFLLMQYKKLIPLADNDGTVRPGKTVNWPRWFLFSLDMEGLYDRSCGTGLGLIERIRILQTAVAMRRYELVNGTLPETIQKLVPEYLHAVPRSPYNGQELSIRVLPSEKISLSFSRKGDFLAFLSDPPRILILRCPLFLIEDVSLFLPEVNGLDDLWRLFPLSIPADKTRSSVSERLK